MKHPILWIHGEALGPNNPALVAYPGRPAVFVFDTALLEGASPAQSISLKRIGFLYECLLELPVTLRRGDGAEQVLAFAGAHGADGIVTSAATDPRFKAICRQLEPHLPLQVLEPEPFVVLEPEPNLGRFSRYWRQAERAVWAHWATAPEPR
jgi:deoxyribodipyrimidine photo-lyase